MQPLHCSIKQAAVLLGVGRTTVYALIATGHIEVVKIGSRALVVMDSIRTYATSLRQGGKP